MDRRILLLFLCTVCQTVFSRPEDWKGKILPSHVYAAKTLLRNVQTVVPKVGTQSQTPGLEYRM